MIHFEIHSTPISCEPKSIGASWYHEYIMPFKGGKPNMPSWYDFLVILNPSDKGVADLEYTSSVLIGQSRIYKEDYESISKAKPNG